MKVSITLVSLFFLNICNAKTDSVVLVVADVIRAMEKPSTVVATLCWQTSKKKHAKFRNAPGQLVLNKLPQRYNKDR